MITAWELYLWTRLESLQWLVNLNGFFLLAWLVTMFVSCIGGLIDGVGSRSSKRAELMLSATCLKISIGFMVFALFIPTKKDAAMLWIVPQLATVENAELLKGEAAEIYTLAKEALKESIGVEEKE